MCDIQITPIDLLSAELLAEIDEQDAKIFTHVIENAPAWSTPCYKVIMWDGVRWVGMIDLFRRTIQVGKVPLTVGGVGGVMTLPAYRGRGYASQMMQKVNTFFRDELDVEFGLLVCNAQRFKLYERVGWQHVTKETRIYHQQADGKHPLPADIQAMIYLCRDRIWPAGDIDFCGHPW